jgi:hypothetical protein
VIAGAGGKEETHMGAARCQVSAEGDRRSQRTRGAGARGPKRLVDILASPLHSVPAFVCVRVYVCDFFFYTLVCAWPQTVLPEDLGLPVGFTDRKGAHALAVEAAKIARITALEGARFVVRALVRPWTCAIRQDILSYRLSISVAAVNRHFLWAVYLVLWCASLDVQISCVAGRTDVLHYRPATGRTHPSSC